MLPLTTLLSFRRLTPRDLGKKGLIRSSCSSLSQNKPSSILPPPELPFPSPETPLPCFMGPVPKEHGRSCPIQAKGAVIPWNPTPGHHEGSGLANPGRMASPAPSPLDPDSGPCGSQPSAAHGSRWSMGCPNQSPAHIPLGLPMGIMSCPILSDHPPLTPSLRSPVIAVIDSSSSPSTPPWSFCPTAIPTLRLSPYPTTPCSLDHRQQHLAQTPAFQ